MPKRKAEDEDDSVIESKFAKDNVDSDDDEDEEFNDKKKYEILKEDDIEGQEAGVVTHDGEVEITPFNMKEELEEGHFDSEGMYHWNKEATVRDNWLENIDWIKIKPNEGNTDNKEESDSEDETPFNDIYHYKQILRYMKAKESVAATLRRLGGSKSLSASERLKRKKAGLSVTDEEKEDREAVTKVTELADAILSRTGNMNIYQETYEEISTKVNNTGKKKAAGYSADLDMYADDFEEKEKAGLENPSTSESNSESQTVDELNDVKWELKRTIDSDKIEGPYSTEQMNTWVNEKHFGGDIWVRKYGSNNDFYSSRRMDFELYL